MKNQSLLIILVSLSCSLSFGNVSYAQSNTTQMMVYSDVPGASSLIAGDYSQAIDEMHAVRSNPSLFLLNNLCVAHILSGQLNEAGTLCDQAAEETKRHRNYGVTWLEQTGAPRIKRLYRARALSHIQILESIIQENKLENLVTQ